MELKTAIGLIEGDHFDGKAPEVWADLGCGAGLFSYALAHLLPAGSAVIAVDRSPAALESHPNPKQATISQKQFDFENDEWQLPPLDGILMANSLHFVRNKAAFLPKIRAGIKEDGRVVIVEYETDVPNPWVPYPLRFESLKALLEQTGFAEVQHLREHPSRYGRARIYAAVAGIQRMTHSRQ
ncbi:MAG: class I SAM-dependent methyltransferase [Lewinellaceae bacterium]|nr:class I SAM-dependent methyltransferase [Lewinellaceae bacterium]